MSTILRFILVLGSVMIWYHIAITITLYGFGSTRVSSILVYGKEVAMIGLMVVGVRLTRECWLGRIRMHKRLGVWIGLCLIYLLYGGVDTLVRGSGIELLMPGIKYDILPVVYLLGATLIGAGLSTKEADQRYNTLKAYLPSVIRICVIGGLLRQGGKMLAPDLFLSIGYGSIGDYAVGTNPPLWYRTGPGGAPRFQGLFSGPNNMGYLFATLLPVLIGWLTTRTTKRSALLVALGVLTMGATLSRGAILGTIVGVGVIALGAWRSGLLPALPKWIIRGAVGVALIGGVGVGALFLIKGGSTAAHSAALVESMQTIAQSPLGYGIGASGPSVHFAGVYLPENQFLQIFIDLGWVGGVLYLLIVRGGLGAVLMSAWESRSMQVFTLASGLVALTTIGLFLHSFEDSMVWFVAIVPLLVATVAYSTGSGGSRELTVSS